MKTLLTIICMSSFTLSLSSFAGNVLFPEGLDKLLRNEEGALDFHAGGIISGSIENVSQGSSQNSEKFRPKDVKEDILDIGDSVYSGGIARLEHYNNFKCKVRELINIQKIIKEKPETLACNKNFLAKLAQSECKIDVGFEYYFSKVKDHRASIFSEKYVCDGEAQLNFSFRDLTTSRQKVDFLTSTLNTKEKIFYHFAYKAITVQFLKNVKSNTKNKVGEYQMASSFQCQNNLFRLPFAEFKKPQGQSCKVSNESCSKHSDCCSMNCIQDDIDSPGVCMQEMSCYRLLARGQTCGEVAPQRFNPYCDNKKIQYAFDNTKPKPTPGEKIVQCIPTNYNTSETNECVETGNKPKDGKLCCSDKIGPGGICVENLKCDICFRGGEVPNGDGTCCPGFYPTKGEGKCIQDFPPLIPTVNLLDGEEESDGLFKNFISIVLNSILSSANAEETIHDSSVLSSEQRKEFDKSRSDCFSGNAGGTEESREALDLCLQGVSNAENEAINQASKTKGQEGEISRKEYISNFNVEKKVVKKSSNFDKCEFHSYNDNWNSSSDTYRNAQMVLMGFEFIHSGKGTEDYWLDDNGKSIFARAKEIAKRLRANRVTMLQKYAEIDKRMEEECKVFFSTMKGKKGDGKTVTSFKDKDVEEDVGLTDEDLENKETTYDSKKEADIAETGRGASGIKHMELIARFTKLRRQAQMVSFAKTADLEKEFKELAEYVEKNRWEQSWDTPTGARLSSTGTFLYDYTVKKLKGFWAVFFIILALAAIVVLFAVAGPAATLLGSKFLVSSAAGAIAGVSLVGSIAVLNSNAWNGIGDRSGARIAESLSRDAMYGDKTREIRDIEYYPGWKKSGWFHKKKKFARHYFAPYFNAAAEQSDMTKGASKVGPNKYCEVHASSRVCFRNIHALIYSEQGQKEQLRFLLDAKIPPFVDASKFETETNFIKMVNDGYTRGRNALLKTKPRGRYVKKRFQRQNFLSQKDLEINFMPKKGKWTPKVLQPEMGKLIVEAAKKFALCKKLEGECAVPDIDKNHYGFGELFSDEKDAQAFGSYVFQHHFLWPSLASTNYMAYPSMSMSSYFHAVNHFLRIVGSLSAARIGSFTDLAGKYENYLMDLEGEYSDGSGVYNGRGSKNATYSKEFYKEFALLNFETGSGVEAFIDPSGNINIPPQFSPSEKELFVTSVNKALRAKEQKEKYDHYKNTVGKTKRGKIKMRAQKDFMSKFGRPVDRMSDDLRQGLGQAVARQLIDKEEKKQNRNQPTQTSYQAATIDAYPSGASGYNGNYNQYDSSSSSGGSQIKTGLSERAKNSMLINNANKMKSDLERDDGDSIFKIVTKAYFRNLDLILEKTTSAKAQTSEVKSLKFERKEDSISNKKKDELKNLLSQ